MQASSHGRLTDRQRARKSYLIRKRGFTEQEALADILGLVPQQNSLQRLQIVSILPSSSHPWAMASEILGGSLSVALRVGLPAMQVLISSLLLIHSTIRALGGPTAENVAIAILLETGVLSLFLTQSKCIWKKLAMRIGAICLVVLGFFVLHTTANADQYRKITQTVSSADEVSSIKKTKDKLETDLADLPATHRTARNELLGQIEAWEKKLSAAKTDNAQGSGVEALQQIFITMTLLRLALQFLNVFFGHSLLEQLKREGFLT